MAKNRVHTVPLPGGGWGNKSEGASRVPKVFNTKAEAQAAGRETAMRRGTEHVIHNRDGQIGGSNSYGSDPHPPKG